MTPRRRVTAAVAAIAALAGGGWGWRRWQQPHAPAPAPAPDSGLWSMSFERPEGGRLVLQAYRGRPLLLNFWATWCPPCVREMPLLSDFQRDHGAAGWQVIGLAVDGPTPVRQFLQRTPVSFPVGLAGLDGIELARRLGNAQGQMPFSVVFDRQGGVLERHVGAVDASNLTRWVQLAA